MITFSKLGSYGRLGNQLFQIASTIGIAIKNKQDFGFPEWSYQNHFDSRLPTMQGIPWATYNEGNPYYRDINLETSVDLEGYFQSWKYFHHCAPYIHTLFQFYKHHYDGVAVHVRRGDYIDKQHIHPILPISYYNEAMKMFRGEHFTIFSDDIDWCKENLKGEDIGYYPTESDIKDFKVMSGFDKFIIANSSYSWWAAYLSKSNDVIAPNTYVLGETRDDRIPDWWKKI